MTIIEIRKFSEINGRVHGYAAEPSPEAAIADFIARFGYEPAEVYFKRTDSGRCTVYCQLQETGGD